jgi:hypothetical protein
MQLCSNNQSLHLVRHGAPLAVGTPSMAQGYVAKDIANDERGWSNEMLGKNLVAKCQKFPLFDANASRMRS